jgi:hypothetical protein
VGGKVLERLDIFDSVSSRRALFGEVRDFWGDSLAIRAIRSAGTSPSPTTIGRGTFSPELVSC